MKKEEKTKLQINTAFTTIINEKDYSNVTIQDILDKSGVSRSAFYLHYKSKDDLLLKYSQHIFHHVFSHVLEEEKTHDFSNALFYDYRCLITHIFYHVKDEKDLFNGMIKSKSNSIFINEIRINISKFVDSYFNNYPYKDEKMPLDLHKSLLVDGYITILKYWINNNYEEKPEEIASYFFELFHR